jgi:hypothetical protein
MSEHFAFPLLTARACSAMKKVLTQETTQVGGTCLYSATVWEKWA